MLLWLIELMFFKYQHCINTYPLCGSFTKRSEMYILGEDNKIDLIKKDIHSNALKVYSKYAKHLDLRAMTFSFLKATKNVADLFVNKQTSIFGDFIIDAIEKISSGKRRVNYYKVEEAHYMILWANRIGEMMHKVLISRLKNIGRNRKYTRPLS